jgi:hypothetical protein
MPASSMAEMRPAPKSRSFGWRAPNQAGVEKRTGWHLGTSGSRISKVCAKINSENANYCAKTDLSRLEGLRSVTVDI